MCDSITKISTTLKRGISTTKYSNPAQANYKQIKQGFLYIQLSSKMSSKIFFIAFFVAIVAAPAALATEYVVGDDAGWKLNFDYQKWADGKPFVVGDKLIFKYTEKAHNVHRVNGTAFQQCMPSDESEALTSGYDVITLATSGRKWYICGVGKHCANGMKLAITVSAEVHAPAPAPSLLASAADKISPWKSCVWMLAAMAVLKMMTA
ncbi:stellacyanin-like [Forsythia ovata]|uniref:Stellacyanin-like n=1 Tax=Forsythia ovata TaxID=205694 RepID=A0ABD1WCJ6_9LAMI